MIADKEKKSASYKEGRLDALSDEKIAKIKKFSKEYIAKVLRKIDKSGKKPRPPSSVTTQATSSTMVNTPDSAEGGDVTMVDMSVEEAMDMSGSEDGEGEDDDEWRQNDMADSQMNGHRRDSDTSTSKNADLPSEEPQETLVDMDDAMDIEFSPVPTKQPSDPRRRPPAESSREALWSP